MSGKTETRSGYSDIDKMSVGQILSCINKEDQSVAHVIAAQLASIETLVQVALTCLQHGGRLVYIGAGTSGRLGILDASECPPTFGVARDVVIGIIAGGSQAITQAIEHAEDEEGQGAADLKAHLVKTGDFVVGLSASGTTPYVIGAMRYCQEHNIAHGCITCNAGQPLADMAQYPVVLETGPEFISGSTRMKAGTATKLVLNMISSALMIRLGHVEDNYMIDMQLTNNKLIERGTQIIMQKLNISYSEARQLLLENGSVRNVFKKYIS